MDGYWEFLCIDECILWNRSKLKVFMIENFKVLLGFGLILSII